MVVKRKAKRTKIEHVVRRIVVEEDLLINGQKVATVNVHYLPDYPGDAQVTVKPEVRV